MYYSYVSSVPLSIQELDSLRPSGNNYYIYENGYLKWEIDHGIGQGIDFYKAKIYKDSIVEWKRWLPKMNVRTYYRID